MLFRLRIGTRLALAFGIILLLSVVSTAYALVAARAGAEATRQLTALPLAKERLVADWHTFSASAVARTALIARSTDNTLSATFAKPIADSVARATELVKQVEPLLVGEVRYGHWTREGRLRHPSWQGLRNDLDPAAVVVEP